MISRKPSSAVLQISMVCYSFDQFTWPQYLGEMCSIILTRTEKIGKFSYLWNTETKISLFIRAQNTFSNSLSYGEMKQKCRLHCSVSVTLSKISKPFLRLPAKERLNNTKMVRQILLELVLYIKTKVTNRLKHFGGPIEGPLP